MEIHLDISGGIAAPLTSRKLKIDSALLSVEQAKELEDLATRVLQEPPPQVSSKLRDAQYYEIVIRRNDQEHIIVAADGGMSANLWLVPGSNNAHVVEAHIGHILPPILPADFPDVTRSKSSSAIAMNYFRKSVLATIQRNC